MSHFAVLVLGENVDQQLAPFHEYECTGRDDQYVQEIDDTEEATTNYATSTTTVYRDTEGGYHRRFTPEGEWDATYWRMPTPQEADIYRAKVGDSYQTGTEIDDVEYYNARWDGDEHPPYVMVKHLPDGWSEFDAPVKDVMTFAEFIENHHGRQVVPYGEEPDYSKTHKYGYTLIDAEGNVLKTIDRTNPNSKWDWFQIGGRWNGFFMLKDGLTGVLGKPGIQTLNKDYTPVAAGRADTCFKGDIDIKGMQDEAEELAAKNYDLFTSVTAGLPSALSWKAMMAKHRKSPELDDDGDPCEVDWAAAREEYGAQPRVIALRENRDTVWFSLEDFEMTREEFLDQHRRRALMLFAVLKDGNWYERGSMGWWGCVSDEKDKDTWEREYTELFNSLPDNTLVTVVDCHI